MGSSLLCSPISVAAALRLKCHLYWEGERTLFMGWADLVKVLQQALALASSRLELCLAPNCVPCKHDALPSPCQVCVRVMGWRARALLQALVHAEVRVLLIVKCLPEVP